MADSKPTCVLVQRSVEYQGKQDIPANTPHLP